MSLSVLNLVCCSTVNSEIHLRNDSSVSLRVSHINHPCINRSDFLQCTHPPPDAIAIFLFALSNSSSLMRYIGSGLSGKVGGPFLSDSNTRSSSCTVSCLPPRPPTTGSTNWGLFFLWYNEASISGYSIPPKPDRKSTRLNSSHTVISYAVFCLKKKKNQQ